MKLENLNEKSQAFDYFLIRAKQLLKHNYGLIGVENVEYEIHEDEEK